AEGITAIAQNSDPFTYFRDQPLRVCENAALDNGTLSVAALKRAAQRDMPMIAARVISEKLRLPEHGQVDHFDGVTSAEVHSTSRAEPHQPRMFPVQVDGDYIGDVADLTLGIEPGALMIVA